MKKLLQIVLAVGVIGLTSCAKEYSCTCTTTDNDPNFDMSSTTTLYYKAKKKDAEAYCKSNESSVSSGGFTLATTCKLN